MAKEVLAIPEEYLAEVIRVIRAGLTVTQVSTSVRENLENWCSEEEAYLLELTEDEGNAENHT